VIARSSVGPAVARHLRTRPGMNKPRDIEPRVFALAVATLRWGRRRPSAWIDRDLVRQFVRATSSIGANLEEARAAETKKDFIHKVGVARKEAVEARYWSRLLLVDADDAALSRLADELNEVAAILTAIVKRSRQSPRRGSASPSRE
jgi:four helix bundle protein